MIKQNGKKMYFRPCFSGFLLALQPLKYLEYQIHPVNVFSFVIFCTIHNWLFDKYELLHHHFPFPSLLLPGLTRSVCFMEVPVIL